jgi:cell division protein FtsW (lipid II flippase)
LKPRNRELVLLIPALLLTILGFVLVYYRLGWAGLGAGPLFYAVIFVVLFVVAHLGIRFLAPNADPHLLPLAALLSAIGMVFIFRLKPTLAFKQSLWFVAGIAAFLLVLAVMRNMRLLCKLRFPVGILGLLTLLLTAFLGQEINGARLWVNIGPIGFQPGEFAKILLVIFFAGYLVDIREVLTVSTRRILGVPLPPLRYLAPLLIVWAVSMALMVFMKDLGTSLLFFGALLALIYAATGRVFYVLVGLALFAGGAALLYVGFGHVRTRVDVWLNPWADAQNKGYQIVQSLFALASGGLFGRGLGHGYLMFPSGRPRIPYVETDFIFSAIGEELGLFGAVAVILLFLMFTYRGFRIATKAGDDFRRLLATGLTSIFALQAFLIMGGVTKLIPLTGITLPFVSYGGSSVVANFVLVALLLRISDRSEAAALVVAGAGRGPGRKKAVERGRVVA